MGYSSGKITAPVNTDDVSAVLGVTSHDVATLCTHEKLEKSAAIFRPRFSSNNPGLYLVGSDGKFSAAANTEIANNISQKPSSGTWQCPNLGIWVQEFVLRNLTPSYYGNMHSYARSTWFVPIPDKGGTASFKILDHFIGYDHNAKIADPIITLDVNRKNSTTNTVQIQMSTPSPASYPGTISVGNMFGTASSASKRWYFGAVVFRGTNAEGITQSDTMLIFGSNVAIKNDAATTVTITKDDTPPNASTTIYYYRIIPFVCDRASVTSATDTTFYSIHMSDDYPGMYTLKAGESASGGGVKDYTFLWSEPYDRNYPVVGGKVVTITPSTYHPDIVATFKARPEGKGTAPLKDLYSRVDFILSYYANGVHKETTYTWRRSGALSTDKVMKRDSTKDNTGGFEDYLFFSIEDATSILNSVSSPSEIEIVGDFYYADGSQPDYGLFATWIPDNSTDYN